MADISNPTTPVTVYCGENPAESEAISKITDLALRKRMCVDSLPSGTGDPTSVIHAGNAFFITSAGIINLAANSNLDIMLVTGAAKEIHLKDISVNVLKNAASGNTQFILYEDITVSADGTAQTVFNNNRRSVVTPDVSVYLNPTITGLGTTLITYLTHNDWETYVAPSYTNNWEIVLKPSSKYLLRVFNNTNQTNVFTYLYWLFQDEL